MEKNCVRRTHIHYVYLYIDVIIVDMFMAYSHYPVHFFSIYAIGDVIHGPMLAHKAEDEGMNFYLPTYHM